VQNGMTRRHFAQAIMAFPAAGVIGFFSRSSASAARSASSPPASLDPTPPCGRGGDLTPEVTEGPYFKANSPERQMLVEDGMNGRTLTITGRVLTPGCTPIAGARLDFWQADAHGVYDTRGFRLRGHQYTDAAGRFRLTTIVPGVFPGRARRIHVKAQAPHGELLTTELYFPGENRNRTDRLFASTLQLKLKEGPTDLVGTFDFVLRPKGITETTRYNV
jgi:protocatechuate 3,4-dioxygenase beta subunit